MNTFGLKKKGQSPFWLKGGIFGVLIEGWRDAIRFSVLIRRKIQKLVEF